MRRRKRKEKQEIDIDKKKEEKLQTKSRITKLLIRGREIKR